MTEELQHHLSEAKKHLDENEYNSIVAIINEMKHPVLHALHSYIDSVNIEVRDLSCNYKSTILVNYYKL